MRPQHALASMDMLEDIVKQATAATAVGRDDVPPAMIPHKNAWKSLRDGLSQAVTFDMSRCPDITEAHIDFGEDLMKRGMFRLPFPVIFLVVPSRAWMVTQLIERNVQLMLCVPFFRLADADDVNADRILDRNIICPSTGEALRCIDGNLAVTHVQIYQSEPNYDPEKDDEWKGQCMAILGAVVMMMSKQAEQKINPAPTRLNIARAKKGKPPINEERIITIRGLSVSRGTPAGGHHASPIMHWRRGHFRTLRHERYGGEERVIPVEPAWVNAGDLLREAVKPRDYVVRP